jgi:hypothetical protein
MAFWCLTIGQILTTMYGTSLEINPWIHPNERGVKRFVDVIVVGTSMHSKAAG